MAEPAKAREFSARRRIFASVCIAAGLLTSITNVVVTARVVEDNAREVFLDLAAVVSKDVLASILSVNTVLRTSGSTAALQANNQVPAESFVVYAYTEKVSDADRTEFEQEQTELLNREYGTNTTYVIKDLDNKVAPRDEFYAPVVYTTPTMHPDVLLVDVRPVGNTTSATFEDRLVITRTNLAATVAAFIDLKAILTDTLSKLNAHSTVGLWLYDATSKSDTLLAATDGSTDGFFETDYAFQFRLRQYRLHIEAGPPPPIPPSVYLFSTFVAGLFLLIGIFFYPALVLRIQSERERERKMLIRDYNAVLNYMVSALRVPLSVIEFTSAALVLEEDLPPVAAGHAKTVFAEAAKVADVVSNYFDITTPDIQARELAEVSTDVHALARTLVNQYSPAALYSVDFVSCIPPEPLHAIVDPVRLRQILASGLRKSLRYTEAGSIVFSVKVEPGIVIFEIKDTGPFLLVGTEHFQVCKKDNVAEFFKQPRLLGGLGMLIARELSARMGATLQYTDRNDGVKGSHFALYVPFKTNNPSTLSNASGFRTGNRRSSGLGSTAGNSSNK